VDEDFGAAFGVLVGVLLDGFLLIFIFYISIIIYFKKMWYIYKLLTL
jgi:hypothetical protein